MHDFLPFSSVQNSGSKPPVCIHNTKYMRCTVHHIVIYLYRAVNETNIKPRWGWHFHSEGAAYVEHGYNEPLFILAVTHKENKIK